MSKPESRRLRPSVSVPTPATPAPTKKTTRAIPRTTRRAAANPEEAEERMQAVAAAQSEARAKNQMVLIGGIAGGLLFLVIVIAVAASGGGGGGKNQPAKRPVAAPTYEPPKEAPKVYNYVRNYGAIVFVCGGSDKHEDKEVLISTCKKCTNKNMFLHEGGVYSCSQCKTAVSDSQIVCPDCGRVPRVTHIKKVGSGY